MWGLCPLPEPQHCTHGFSLCLLLCDFIPFQGLTDLDMVPEDTYEFLFIVWRGEM